MNLMSSLKSMADRRRARLQVRAGMLATGLLGLLYCVVGFPIAIGDASFGPVLRGALLLVLAVASRWRPGLALGLAILAGSAAYFRTVFAFPGPFFSDAGGILSLGARLVLLALQLVGIAGAINSSRWETLERESLRA